MSSQHFNSNIKKKSQILRKDITSEVHTKADRFP